MFVSLLSTLRSEYSPDQQTIIGCPTQEQLAAILASVMHVQVGNIEDMLIDIIRLNNFSYRLVFVIVSWTWYIVVCVCHTHFRDNACVIIKDLKHFYR